MDSSPLSFTSFSSSQPNHALVSFPSKMVSNENGVAASMENAAATLASNPTFLSAIFALFFTQSNKVFLNFFDKKQWNFRLLFSSQGMPSTRSALCSALTTSVALSHGVADSFFPVSLGFSLIVMCDAVAVKSHVGFQAVVINTILDNMLDREGRPVLEERVNEDVGDTFPQVLTGALFGSTVAVLCCLGFMMLR